MMKSPYITVLALWYIVTSSVNDLIKRLNGQNTSRYLYRHGDYFEFK